MRRRDFIKLIAGAAAVLLLLAMTAENSVHAQESAGNPGSAINLGGRGWLAPEERPERAESQLKYEIRGGFVTDYIYRGTTLSDHKPAIGAAAEITFAQLYAGVAVASVKLPTQPAAEITVTGGMRKNIADINFDIGMTYFLYPGQTLVGATPSLNYWEAGIRADKKIAESIRVAGGFAYSPNVSNTGAWSWYAAAGLGYEVPSRLLPMGIGVSFTGGAGYSWFGNQFPELGGFALPAYLNWQAGVTFARKVFNLDLRYYNTNLSRENCFVLTGDPGAIPGGTVNPVTNPEGLMSRWCRATFVAKLWFALD
jgi:uncharacterized protein (TIGR02001 family)